MSGLLTVSVEIDKILDTFEAPPSSSTIIPTSEGKSKPFCDRIGLRELPLLTPARSLRGDMKGHLFSICGLKVQFSSISASVLLFKTATEMSALILKQMGKDT